MQTTETKPRVAAPETTRTDNKLRLVFVAGRIVDPPLTVPIEAAGTAIGRAPGRAGFEIEDARASRHHATLRREPGGELLIIDARSRNGTRVNGTAADSAHLALGDVISLGDSCFVVAEDPRAFGDAAIDGMHGDSTPMRRARSEILRAGKTSATVLIEAESGCGKELAARAVHLASGARGKLVSVNCAAVPENLFESQFFGHTRGAFTGASEHAGFFREAESGTLFLDEVGELPLCLQPKLLRVLEEGAVTPVGASRPVPCSARIVAATNRDLEAEVERGSFRRDLFARLFDIRIALPALRHRRDDVLVIFGRAFNGPPPALTHDAAEALVMHEWPLNVRELRAIVKTVRTAQTREPIGLGVLRARLPTLRTGQPLAEQARPSSPPTRSPIVGGAPDRQALARLLEDKRGVVADVARAVGRSRRQVLRWLEKHGLDPLQYRQ